MIKRVLSIILIVSILIVPVSCTVLGITAYFLQPDDPPPVSEAPWVVQTSSRVYYARSVSSVNGNPAIKGYWVSSGRHYKFYPDVQVFDKKIYGQVAIIRRVK